MPITRLPHFCLVLASFSLCSRSAPPARLGGMHRFAALLRPTQRFADARRKPQTNLIHFCLVLALSSLCCRGPLGRHLALARAASATTDVSTQLARSPRRFYFIFALFSRCSRYALALLSQPRGRASSARRRFLDLRPCIAASRKRPETIFPH